jgi:voltage-gated potassium channel
MVFASCIMVVGVGFFGFVLGNVASLISRMDSAKVHQAETLDRVESFMGYHDIPQNLRQKVRAYYRYLWESRRGYDDGAVLSDLPSNLRSDLAMFMNGDVIEKVPLLKGAEPEVMRDIVLQLRPTVTIPGEEIFRQGEFGEAMHFIQRGTVEILAPNGNLIVTLRDGQFFGEMALLNNSLRSATAKSSSYCDLFTLERKAFEKVLARHPQFEASIRETTLARTQKSA